MSTAAPTTDGRKALRQARRLCETMREAPDRRRELWRACQDAGFTAQEIADACGVGVKLVHLEIAKARGYEWAIGDRG